MLFPTLAIVNNAGLNLAGDKGELSKMALFSPLDEYRELELVDHYI